MAGKSSAASTGVSVAVRASVSATQPAAGGLLDLQRHHVAAVRIGADRQRLQFQRVEARGIAAPDIAVEGGFALARSAVADDFRLAAQRRTRGGQRQLVEGALLLVQRAVDA